MKKKESSVIPEYVVREQERKPFEQSFYGSLNACKEAYAGLMAMRDLEGTIPSELKDIKAESVNYFVDERIREIGGAKMLTHESKEKAKAEWEYVRDKAIGYIDIINKFLTSYPGATTEIIGGIVICTNDKDFIVENCKIKTPKEAFEHYDLICAAEDAFKKLQEYERNNNFPTGDLFCFEMDLRMKDDPTLLVLNWIHQSERKKELDKRAYLREAMRQQERTTAAKHAAWLEERAREYNEAHPNDYTLGGSRENIEEGNVTLE